MNANFKVETTPAKISDISGVASGKTRIQNIGTNPIYYGNHDKNGYRVIPAFETVVISDIANVHIWADRETAANAETAS